MSRSNWSILAALIGLVIAAAFTFQLNQFYQAAEQRQASYNYQPANKPGFRIDRATKAPTEYHKPSCNNPYSREDADLCAQWAAVDQVAESNRLSSLNIRLTVLSFFSTVVATLFLIWTFWETRETARRELRAYVTYCVDFISFEGNVLNIKHGPHNTGQTPARAVRWFVTTALHPRDPDESVFNKGGLPPEPSNSMLGAGVDRPYPHPISLTDEEMNDLTMGTRELFVFGMVEYKDVFGMKRVTKFRRRLYADGGDHFYATRFGNEAT